MRRQLTVAVLVSAGMSCTVKTTSTRAPQTPAAAVAPFERQIRNAQDSGDGDYELNQLRRRTVSEPDNLSVRLDLAKAYRARGYPDVALEISRLAAARFPDSGEAELSLIADLHATRQRAEAVASLEAFLKAHPQTNSAYYSWLGILLDDAGQYTGGEPQHRKALELSPANASLHNNLGYNLLMQKKFSDAAEEFRAALKWNPVSEIARNNLGTALAAQNSPKQAISSFQNGSDPATAHNNLAAVMIENGNYAEARKELSLALGYNKAHSAALRNLELVSRLDGHNAALPRPSAPTRWQRLKTGVIRLFVGPLDQSVTEAAKTASTH